MKMHEWAEQECRIACKKENPNFDFDDPNAWDYGCSCYKSALKAYESLMNDDHSGASFGFTKNILIRLMNGQPLTPITDEDFFANGNEPYESDESLADRGLKSSLQCTRMSSLFRDETLDGKVTYHDIDRAYYVNIEDPSDTYHSWTGFLDEMFPIKIPYSPEKDKYVIYAQSFLSDKRNGDFDTRGILYLITPSGEKVDINIYQTERNGKMANITKEEYENLLKNRVDKINEKVASDLLWTLISNSASDEEINRRETKWKTFLPHMKNDINEQLSKLCMFFCSPENYKYNTFHIRQSLCRGEFDEFKDNSALVVIGEYLQHVLKLLA